jgi:uncharacterized membrane protein YqjE
MREVREVRPGLEVEERISLGGLLSELVSQVEQLMSAHLRLLREELTTDGRKMAVQSMGLVGGAVLAVLGLAFLGVAALAGLALVLPGWAAALIVAAVFLLGGGALAYLSLQQLRRIDPTNRTREETQETLAWLTRRR